MLNVEQITSQLARLPDNALQRYAMMHKDDPYVLSLALSESNRRKELRAGAAMGQAQQAQNQPKVADQALASMAPQPVQPPAQPMLPEQTGIGQLPVQNIQRMAEGGIAGYSVGGVMSDYNPATGPAGRLAYENEPVLKMADGGVVAFSGEDGSLVSYDHPLWAKIEAATKRQQEAREREAAAERLKKIQATAEQARTAFAQTDPRIASMQQSLRLREEMQQQLRDAAASSGASSPAPAPGASTTPSATPSAGLPGLITSPAAAQAELNRLQTGAKPEVPDVLRTGISELQAAQEAMANRNVADIQKEQAARGLFGTEMETRLKAREARLGERERSNTSMSLLQAGLAILGGTSPFAMANIGAGAQVGVRAYTEGAEKLQAARDKLDDSFAKLEEVRRNEGRMDSKELRDARMAAMQPAIDAKKLTISALEKDWGLKRQDALKVFETTQQNARTVFEQSQQTARTNAQIAATLNTPERQLWNDALRRNNNDTSAAFREMQTLKAEKFNPYQSYADYLKAFAGKENVFSPPMGFADYASQFSIPTTTAPPKNATVRTLPGAQ